MNEIVVVAHNIRSTHNIGSIFRTADAMGVSKIYLTGYSPLPLDRFGRPQKDIAKTALGAEQYIAWDPVTGSPGVLIKKLQSEGFTVCAVEQSEQSVSIDTFLCPKKVVIIMGNEVRGVSRSLQSACDAVLEIPMYGKKESLNVSVATGIVLHALRANT